MNKRNLKLIMELIFIFILPLLFICFTSEIQVEREFTYDNQGNYETSADTKKLSFDNSIIKYTDGYKNIINDFNIWDEVTEIYALNYLSSKNPIKVTPNTTYYFNTDGNSILELDSCDQDGNNKNAIGFNIQNGNLTIPPDVDYIWFYMNSSYGTTYNHDICINLSVSWANGNYAPYGKPLILITQTDVSGQNNINYTIWGNIKELLIGNLELNDNVLLDIVFCYTILWVIMFLIWHLIYGFLELIFHIIPKRWERDFE